MRVLLCLGVVLLGAAVVLGQDAPPARAATVDELFALVPPQAEFVLLAPNLPRTVRRLREGLGAALLSHPSVQPLLRESGFDLPLQNAVWAILDEARGAGFIAALPSGDPENPRMLAAISVSGKGDALLAALDKAEALAAQREVADPAAPPTTDSHEETEYLDQTIDIVRTITGEGAEQRSETFALTVGRGVFLLASDVALLKRVMVALQQGNKGGLPSADAFAAVDRGLPDEPDLRLIMPVQNNEDARNAFGGPEAKMVGFDTVTTVAWQMRLQKEGVVTDALFVAPGQQRGLMRILAGAGAEPTLRLPVSAQGVLTLGFDYVEAWRECVRMGEVAEPGTAAAAAGMVEQVRQQTGLHVVDDVLASLAPEISLVLMPGDGPLPDPATDFGAFVFAVARRTLVLQRVRDDERQTKVFAVLDAILPAAVDFMGHALYMLPGPQAGLIARLPGLIVAGAGSGAVRDVIRGHAKEELPTLRDSAEYKHARELVGGGAICWFSPSGANSWITKLVREGVQAALREELRDAAERKTGEALLDLFFDELMGTTAFAVSGNEVGLRTTWYFGLRGIAVAPADNAADD